MLDFYITGPFSRREELREVAKEIYLSGNNVVSSWLWMPGGIEEGATAEIDLRGVMWADRLLVFLDPNYPSLGTHTELGFFLGWFGRGKEDGVWGAARSVTLIGERTSPFHYLAGLNWAKDWDNAKQQLKIKPLPPRG